MVREDELQRASGRQGLLPDFRLQLLSPAGNPEYRLAELKMIGAIANVTQGVEFWPEGRKERRVFPLPGEYSKPLDKLDRK